MKKILFLLSAAIMLFASCEGPAGRDGLDEETYWYVRNYTIRSNDWELVNGVDQIGSYYRAEIEIPQLDREIYELGNVFCYMYYIDASGTEVQTLLPYIEHFGESTKVGEELWTKTISCDFTRGSIMFYVQYSDFFTGLEHPGTVRFRVVLNL